jgi:hypothetical protein
MRPLLKTQRSAKENKRHAASVTSSDEQEKSSVDLQFCNKGTGLFARVHINYLSVHFQFSSVQFSPLR